MRNITRTIFFLFIISGLLSVPVLSAVEKTADRNIIPPDVTVSVDGEEVHVGDHVTLTLTARDEKGIEIDFPEDPGDLGEFTFVRSEPVKGFMKRGVVGREYVMSIYTTGTHVIPPIEVSYRAEGTGPWDTVRSPQVPLSVQSLLTGDYTDIRDIREIFSATKGIKNIVIFLIILAVMMTAGWLIRGKMIKDRQVSGEEMRPPHEIAYDELDRLKAKNLPGEGRIKEYFTDLSDIIRRYIERRFSFRAPEMTTEEFMYAIKRSTVMEEEYKKVLREFLLRCDMVKFAKYGPTPLEIIDSFNAAERFVDRTRETEEESDTAG